MTNRNTIVIGIVAAVAAIGAYWMLVLSPKRDEAAKLDKDLTAQRASLETTRATLAEYQKAKTSYKANYSTVARLGKAVPEEDDVRSLVVQLDSAAKRSKVDFRTITVGSTDATKTGATAGQAGFVTMPFTFAFDGKFFGLSNFMSNLERFVKVHNNKIDVTGRLLVLESLELKPGQNGFPNIDATIGATSYTLPRDQGLTNGATPQAPSGDSAAPAGSASGGSTATSTTATVTGVK